MLYDQFERFFPITWTPIDPEVKEVDVSPDSAEYERVLASLNDFCYPVTKITRVQNPYLYLQFLLKQAEYETRQSSLVLQQYHVTAAENVHSIVSENFDRRLVSRAKFGQGVSFSPFPIYAHERSNKCNGIKRAIIVASVLVKNIETVEDTRKLPGPEFDTTSDDTGHTFVKYYDNEYYPHYVIYYIFVKKYQNR